MCECENCTCKKDIENGYEVVLIKEITKEEYDKELKNQGVKNDN